MKTKNYVFVLILLALGFSGFSQNKQVLLQGSVKDSNTGESLVGVVVQVQGTKSPVVTDATGRFKLNTNHSLPFTVVV